MCDPITIAAIASAAATAGGNYIQQKSNNDSLQSQYNARNAEAEAGVQQQQSNIASGQSQLDSAIQKLSGPSQQASTQALANSRTGTINANTTPATGTTDPATNIADAPQVVQSDLAAKMGKAATFANQQGTALGNLGATGDQFAQNSTMLANDTQNLADLANKANSEKNVNLIQQQSAYNNARKAPNIFGQLLSTAGTIGGLASSGGFANIANGVGSAAKSLAGGIGDYFNPANATFLAAPGPGTVSVSNLPPIQ